MSNLYHGHIVTEDDGAGEMIHQLMDAYVSRCAGEWKRFPEQIWLDTMKCFARFVGEHRASYGYDGFDRGFWTTRQVQAKLFRIGELEYEMLPDPDGKPKISLHIPSDADIRPSAINASVKAARAFFAEYFPAYADAPIWCDSWMLSPKLKELLPATAKILGFQNAFDIISEDSESKTAISWVFKKTKIQQETLDFNDLPEKTTLQRKIKALLLKGKAPGMAQGFLVREFE